MTVRNVRMLGVARMASITLLLIAAAGAVSAAAADSPFEAVFRPYDSARRALMRDDLRGARSAAGQVSAAAREAEKRAAGGTNRGKALPPCCQPLPEIARAADDVAKAADLAVARTAFGRMSAALIRYRNGQGSRQGIEVFCPIVKRSWLQPPGQIGNPYFGPARTNCGEINKHG